MSLGQRIREIAAKHLEGASAETLSSLIDAASERAADIIPTASRHELGQAAQEASAAMQAIIRNHDVDRHSPDFLAGRLAALCDLYGYAASVTADANIAAPLEHPAYATVFDAVARGYSSSEDIANETASEPAEVRAILAELCCASLLAEFRHGHGRHYELSPVGRLVYSPQVLTQVPAAAATPF